MQNEIQVNNELIPVSSINVPQLFTDIKKAKFIVAAIREKAMDFKNDLSTVTSRKAIASQAYKVAQSKTFLDGLGKDFLADLKSQTKSGDAIRKFIRDECDAIKSEVRKDLDAWEDAEKERLEHEAAEVQYLSDWDDALHENNLFDRQREIERKEAEFRRQEEEKFAKEAAERAEKDRIEREKRIAEEAAEKARQEAAAAARAEQERVEREKQEAEERAAKAERERIEAIERAKIEAELAEKRRQEAAKQAERDRLQAIKDAEDRARREAEQKERERLAKEAADKAEAERKAQNKAHKKKINNAALVCFEQAGIETELAKQVITLIANGQIEYVTINY